MPLLRGGGKRPAVDRDSGRKKVLPMGEVVREKQRE